MNAQSLYYYDRAWCATSMCIQSIHPDMIHDFKPESSPRASSCLNQMPGEGTDCAFDKLRVGHYKP